jgi:hypothetical protein
MCDSLARHAHQIRDDRESTESLRYKWFPAILTNADADGAGVSHIARRMRRCIITHDAHGVRAPTRQHFLKRDAVFLIALVYSG